MSELTCNNAAKSSDAQASLLCNREAAQEAARRTPRAAHDTRGGCMLTQSRAAAHHAAELSSSAGSASDASKEPVENVYAPRARITCVDRAVIRTYFQPYDTGTLVRRKKGAGYKCAVKRRDWDGGLLPEDLERRLTQLPEGYYRMLRGSAVLLVEERTQKVVDAVRGVRQG